MATRNNHINPTSNEMVDYLPPYCPCRSTENGSTVEGGSHTEGEAAPLAEDDGGGGGGGGGDPGAARRKVARMKERRACIILGTYVP